MGRRVQVLVPQRVQRWMGDGYEWQWEIWDATWTVGKAIGLTFKPETNTACAGVFVGGCGFSATFEVLSRIGAALYPDDRKLADAWTRIQDR